MTNKIKNQDTFNLVNLAGAELSGGIE